MHRVGLWVNSNKSLASANKSSDSANKSLASANKSSTIVTNTKK